MGNTDTKLNFRKAVVELTTKTQPVEASDEAFWNQFWSDSVTCVQDVFTLIPAAEIRALREENPSNLATLCYKAVEKLVQASENGCKSPREQQTVLNCIRLLTRLLPYIFEDPDWRGFFWSTLPGQAEDTPESGNPPLAQSLIAALSDLLFCPGFTVGAGKKGSESTDDIQTIDSCEFIWEAGVGFAHSPQMNTTHDQNRTEILKLMLTCFSESMYLPPIADAHATPNQWIGFFTSTENRHALPLFTSLLNVVCSYDPVGYGVPYNHLMFNDSREPLVEVALQVLCVTLDNDPSTNSGEGGGGSPQSSPEPGVHDSLFMNYLSRIHREEDFEFVLKGLTRLLNNPLQQTYLPGSSKKIQFYQELLVLFWKMCDINKKFMFYVLKSSDVLDILVPILFHLNDARADQSRVGLMHIGVFILLLLSGERNFGVRLNKPYTVRVPMDIPVFTGTHADFLIIVFHKIITTGHQRLQPLFDCLLTIIVNVSPYLKTLSMVASTKMLHLLEAFSTPWFLYASPTNHHLVFFLLEVFNNIIQYQFDGNANLVYTIIRKRNVFHQLANLPTDHSSIAKALSKKGRKLTQNPAEKDGPSMEGSTPATEAEPGTLKTSLAAIPALPKVSLHAEELRLSGDGKSTNQEASGDIANPELWQPSSPDATHLVTAWSSSTAGLPAAGEGHMTSVGHPNHRTEEYLDHITATDSQTEDQRYQILSSDRTSRAQKSPHLSGVQQRQIERKVTLSQCARQPSTNLDNEQLKGRLVSLLGIEKMTEKSPASAAHTEQQTLHEVGMGEGAESVQPVTDDVQEEGAVGGSNPLPEGQAVTDHPTLSKAQSMPTPPGSPTQSEASVASSQAAGRPPMRRGASVSSTGGWVATPDWVMSWKQKLPLQTIMRLLQVLVPQVEKICIDKGLTDESEILKFLQHGTLVGLLPVPHPILIRKYQANSGTTMWFRTYMWGVIYLRNVDPPVWYDTDVKLFEIQRV